MRYATPLRYPGGKARLASHVAEILHLNELTDGCYAEPFCGGAGVALELLFSEQVRLVHLNDVDRSIASFWSVATRRSDELCRIISDTPVDLDVWRRQREIQSKKEEADELELAFSTFFLNRTNRSGILTAGVIGGFNQTGAWKIDARYNKEALIARIERIGLYADRISTTQLDVNKFIERVIPSLPSNSLVYLDPPYYRKADRLYLNHFQHNDHVNLGEKIKSEIHVPWIVSYDYTPQIVEIYRALRQEKFNLSYSAQAYYKAEELMIYSDKIKIPGSLIKKKISI